MLANIFSALEQLGLTAQKRAIHVQFSNPALNTEVALRFLSNYSDKEPAIGWTSAGFFFYS